MELRLVNRETSESQLKKNADDLIISKPGEISFIITNCATENRALAPERIIQRNSLKAEIDATKSKWESAAHNAFLSSHAPSVTKSDSGISVLKAGELFAKDLEGTYPDEFKRLSLGKLLRGYQPSF